MTELNATGLDLWGYAASLRSSEGNLTGLSYQGTVNNSLFPSMWEYFRLGLFFVPASVQKARPGILDYFSLWGAVRFFPEC